MRDEARMVFSNNFLLAREQADLDAAQERINGDILQASDSDYFSGDILVLAGW